MPEVLDYTEKATLEYEINSLMAEANQEGIELRKAMNKLISEFESKFKKVNLVITPITSTHESFDPNGERIQLLGLSFFLP